MAIIIYISDNHPYYNKHSLINDKTPDRNSLAQPFLKSNRQHPNLHERAQI